MIRRMIGPLAVGIVGTAILLWLGVWQVQRLAWKEGVLADIDARIAAAPVPLPAAPDPEADRFKPVEASGRLTDETLRVLASIKRVGAVHRIIAVLDADGRRVLVDLGYVSALTPAATATPGPITVTGNLHWPDEVDRFTPEPGDGLWFARDVPAMAAALGTEPVLIVARTVSPADPVVTPLPVDTSGIPNDHLEYAITWFSLAVVWLGMTGWLLWRIRRRTV